jgi:serine/threonine protein kinase
MPSAKACARYSLPWAISSHASDALRQLLQVMRHSQLYHRFLPTLALQPQPQSRISLASLRAHPFFSDAAPSSPLLSPSSSRSLANSGSFYDNMTSGSQDMSSTPSARFSASTPSTVRRPRTTLPPSDKALQAPVGSSQVDGQMRDSCPQPPALDPSLRIVSPPPPSSPLLAVTCSFGCISLYTPSLLPLALPL